MNEAQEKQESWWDYFLTMLDPIRARSEDPSTQVAALLTGQANQILTTGYNGLPRGVEHLAQRLNQRPMKYDWIEHAERNAIFNAARHGVALDFSTLVTDGIPCVNCGRAAIQVGVDTIVVAKEIFNTNIMWIKEASITLQMCKEAHIPVWFKRLGETRYTEIEVESYRRNFVPLETDDPPQDPTHDPAYQGPCS